MSLTGVAGQCILIANQEGSLFFTVAKANQTISFAALSNRPLGSALFTVSATASSGLAVTFASTTPSTCAMSGATVTLAAEGVRTIRAQQGGNANYNAAPNVDRSFTVLPTGSGFNTYLPLVDR